MLNVKWNLVTMLNEILWQYPFFNIESKLIQEPCPIFD